VLVNNAGISQRTAMLDTDMAAYRQLMEIDLFAPMALTKALAPAWVERGNGHVVVVSSVFGYIAMARRTGYAAPSTPCTASSTAPASNWAIAA
jgi:short-subunit dehydrogenase